MDDIIGMIKSRVSMKDVLAYYGQYPIRNNYKCFAHDDHHPSASITKKGDKFYCFSCNWKGDIFDVVQYFEKCDNKKAIKIINNNFHLGILEELSIKDKRELKKIQEQREKEKQEKEYWHNYEKQLKYDIINGILYWYQVNTKSIPTKGQVKNNKWETEKLFYYSLKKIDLLDWLWNIIACNKHDECEYDFIYGKDKKNVMKKVHDKEINIFV